MVESLDEDLEGTLTREQCLASAKLVEESKLKTLMLSTRLAKMKVPMEVMTNIMRFEALKFEDQHFLETGNEMENFEASLRKLNLKEDDEYKALLADTKTKADAFKLKMKR